MERRDFLRLMGVTAAAAVAFRFKQFLALFRKVTPGTSGLHEAKFYRSNEKLAG